MRMSSCERISTGTSTALQPHSSSSASNKQYNNTYSFSPDAIGWLGRSHCGCKRHISKRKIRKWRRKLYENSGENGNALIFNLCLTAEKTLNGLKQATMQFWRLLLKTMKKMGHERSKVDPCM